jgi:putative ABC transport system permease protein
VGTLWQDVRFGLRTLRKSPGFAVVAVLALAIGIGAISAIFSIADAFLFKSIDLPDPGHLVVLLEQTPGQTGEDSTGTAPANFLDWKRLSTTMDDMTAWIWDRVSLTGEGVPEIAQGYQVTANFFSIGGATPLMGHSFTPEECAPGRDDTVILSEGLWRSRFGADPQIIGKVIHVDGSPHVVVGVMPRTFHFPVQANLWLPLSIPADRWARRDWRGMFAMGRLKAGLKPEDARAEMNAIAGQLGEAYPSTNRGWHVMVMPIREYEVGTDIQNYSLFLLVTVGFVLLLVCANIANLQFVRGAGRAKEIAIRAALGANRWRIVRQLLTESVLIALAGAALGLLIANWALRLFLVNMPADVSKNISGWNAIRLDWRVMAFAILVAAAAGILSGLLPALEGSRVGLGETLKEGGRSSSSARGRHRIRGLLVVIQMTLAVTLLAAAGLLVRTFHRIESEGVVSRPGSLLTTVINLPLTRYPYADHPRIAHFYDEALPRLAAIPGVQDAALTTSLPYANGRSIHNFSIEGRSWRSPSEAQNSDINSVSPSYFRVVGIPLIRGRETSDRDSADAQQVVVINQTLARTYFQNEDPIGHRIKFGSADDTRVQWLTIVGVVGDVKMDWSTPGSGFQIYAPYQQFPRTFSTFILRTSLDPNSLSSAVRAAVLAVDAEQPLAGMKLMSQVIRESTINVAYVAAMMSALSGLALALAAIGVYGVLAYIVAESTHEIGMRMALGALPGNILRLIVGRGMMLAAAGIVIGVPVYFLAAKLLGSYLAGMGPADAISPVVAALLILVVASAACLIPARRATRVDPMVSLRHE